MLAVLQSFSTLFCSSKTWSKALLLLTGAVLCSGRRTVCGVLRCLGKGGEESFSTFHRILNQRAWDAHQGARMLLQQLTEQSDEPVVIGIDEHLERRSGKKIHERGYYRDPVRSSKTQVVKTSGLKWVSMMVLKPVPWAKRVFALPFLTVLAPHEESPKCGGSKYKPQMVCQIRHWLPERLIILFGDGTYATAELAMLQAGNLSGLSASEQCQAFCSSPSLLWTGASTPERKAAINASRYSSSRWRSLAPG